MGSFSRKSWKFKVVVTIVMWVGTFSLGFVVSMMGACLVELSHKFHTDIATVSRMFPIFIGSALLGTICCATVFQHIPRQLTSALLLSIMGFATMFLPFVPSIHLLYIMSGLIGFGSCGYDSVQIVWIVDVWRDSGNSTTAIIQTQHFISALGSCVSPLMCRYFLTNITEDDSDNIQKNLSTNASSLWALRMCFIIGGFISIAAALLQLISYKFVRYECNQSVIDEHTCITKDNCEKDDPKIHPIPSSSTSPRIPVIIVGGIFIGIYWGLEDVAFEYLPAFGHLIKLHLNSGQGASALSEFGAAFTIGRALGIVAVLKFPPQIILALDLLLASLANWTLVIGDNSWPAFTAGSIILGCAYSTFYAPCFAYIERHMEIDRAAGSWLVAIGTGIDCLLTTTVGTFIENYPYIFVYTNLGGLVIGLITFLILPQIFRIYKQIPIKRRKEMIDCDEEPLFSSHGQNET